MTQFDADPRRILEWDKLANKLPGQHVNTMLVHPPKSSGLLNHELPPSHLNRVFPTHRLAWLARWVHLPRTRKARSKAKGLNGRFRTLMTSKSICRSAISLIRISTIWQSWFLFFEPYSELILLRLRKSNERFRCTPGGPGKPLLFSVD